MTDAPVLGRTLAESTPSYPPVVRAPEGAPNVLLVLLDDTGFAQLGCFGSDIETPTFDRLAAGGLRYHRFHVTALCSPTRAALLTGRNHHAVGMGFLTDVPTGFPGYCGRIPRSAATLPRILRDAGYNTMAVGKWHLAPRWDQHQSGPFDRWPLGLGFERYYGFPAGDTNHYAPNLVRDNSYVDPPRTPDEGYHLTEDLADEAIRMIGDQRQTTPHKPFFMYFATGAMHAPHHAPKEWIDRYRGRFDDGWDAWRERLFARQVAEGIVPSGTELTPRPDAVSAWSDLTADEQRVFARQMEVFAGFLSHTDHQIGRIVSFLERFGLLDDTLLLLISDNGASAEGGPIGSVNEHRFAHGFGEDLQENLDRIDDLGGTRAYNHYAWGWAWAGNTPLRLWKRYAWLGGTRTPLVVHWPRGFSARGEVRSQFCHAIDLMPTVLDAAGITPASVIDGIEQQPIEGRSLRATFDDGGAPPPRDTQYFEMLGSRAIYHDGWKATTDHVGGQLAIERELLEGSDEFTRDRWALFHLDTDFSEAADLAAAEPERLEGLVQLWDREARRNDVYPLDDTFIGRAAAMYRRRYGPHFRTVLRPGGGPVAEDVAPALGSGFTVTALVDPTDDSTEGVLCAQGNWTNGWAWYVQRGHLVYVFNGYGHAHRIESTVPIPRGARRLEYVYERAAGGGGTGRLLVDGEEVGRGTIPHDLPFRWQIGGAGLTIGYDRGFPVSDDYTPPFPYRGFLHEVVFEIPALAPGTDSILADIGIALLGE